MRLARRGRRPGLRSAVEAAALRHQPQAPAEMVVGTASQGTPLLGVGGTSSCGSVHFRANSRVCERSPVNVQICIDVRTGQMSVDGRGGRHDGRAPPSGVADCAGHVRERVASRGGSPATWHGSRPSPRRRGDGESVYRAEVPNRLGAGRSRPAAKDRAGNPFRDRPTTRGRAARSGYRAPSRARTGQGRPILSPSVR